jgi:pyridoxine 5-phosphate synthase
MLSTERVLRLGVNLDHVATLRNARGGTHPDPVRAARIATEARADGITAHLREDRRHITDDDVVRLRHEIQLPLNLEMAPTDEMLKIARALRPHACCIVPERRQERTTEGGIDAAGQRKLLAPIARALGEVGIRVALFVAPERRQLEAAVGLGAPVVELHTGAYAEAGFANDAAAEARELAALRRAASEGAGLGLEIHAGHGLTYANVGAVAAIPEIVELNIGHFIVGEAMFIGLDGAIRRMRAAMDAARRLP